MKDNDLARRAVPVRRRRVLKSIASKGADEAIATRLAQLLEKKKITTVPNVITDREISPNKFHIADLALTRVRKSAIVTRAVAISVLIAAFTGKQENERCQPRRRNAALPLPTIGVVDVANSIVDAAGLEGRQAGQLLLGTLYVEPKFSKPTGSGIFSSTELLRPERGSTRHVLVRNARDRLTVVGVTIAHQDVATSLSEAIGT